MKKVKQDNLKVNAVIYREERPSESFEINALQDGVGLTLSISNAIDDYKPIDSSKPTGNFFSKIKYKIQEKMKWKI